MEEKNIIKPEVRQYHILGFNRTVIRDLMAGDVPNGSPAMPMCNIRNTTYNFSGTALSDKTVKRWQQGEDIYLGVLLNVCDELQIDPLRWICVDGKPFKSTLEDLYRLEQSGTDCATLLRERGIEPVGESDHQPMTENEWKVALIERQEIIDDCPRLGKAYARRKTAQRVSALDERERIQQIVDIQRGAFEQANRVTATIRREYQELLNDANIKLGAAENEVRRLRDELRRMNEMLAHIHEGGISDIDEPSGMTAADDAKRE